MEQYIPKSALVAEIEKRIKINKECMLGLRNLDYYQGKVDALNDTISSINTLEVKEVDLEKEVINWWNAHYSSKAYTFEGYSGHYLENSTLIEIAKHFFGLGLQAQHNNWKVVDNTNFP